MWDDETWIISYSYSWQQQIYNLLELKYIVIQYGFISQWLQVAKLYCTKVQLCLLLHYSSKRITALYNHFSYVADTDFWHAILLALR